MPKRLISSENMPFAPKETPTYGLEIQKEVWQMDDGAEKIYWKYALPNSVQIFALTTKLEIIAVSEFQPSVGTDYLHLVGETMEKGETPFETAMRGLREETGFRAGKMELMSSIFENSGRSNRLIHMILATKCVKVATSKEDGIQVRLMDRGQFWKTLMDYFFSDNIHKHGGGNTLKATTLAFQKLGWLELTGMTDRAYAKGS